MKTSTQNTALLDQKRTRQVVYAAWAAFVSLQYVPGAQGTPGLKSGTLEIILKKIFHLEGKRPNWMTYCHYFLIQMGVQYLLNGFIKSQI